MRIKIGIIVAYLLLGCLLLEDALPYFADSECFEMCESKLEQGEKDGKKEKEIDDDLKEVKDRFSGVYLLDFAGILSQSATFSDVENIPAGATRTIVSPPPDRV